MWMMDSVSESVTMHLGVSHMRHGILAVCAGVRFPAEFTAASLSSTPKTLQELNAREYIYYHGGRSAQDKQN